LGNQYRPEDPSAAIATYGEISDMFASVGAAQARLLVAMTQDVGTIAVVTNWESLGHAIAAFDPVEGTAIKAIGSSPTMSATLAASGPPLRRVIGNIDFSFGDTSAGKYAVNVVQTTSAGPELWAEVADLAWSTVSAAGVAGMQVGRVVTGEGTGQNIATLFTDDVNQFSGVLNAMPARLVELFAATGTSTLVRNVHRVISA
jgi:hypothetical protein